MSWLKHVIVDLVVTAFIVFAVLSGFVWAWWIVLIYALLMLVLKVAGLASRRRAAGLRSPPTGVPTWFYHVLYALNVGVSALAGWWLVAGLWIAIWIISYVQVRSAS